MRYHLRLLGSAALIALSATVLTPNLASAADTAQAEDDGTTIAELVVTARRQEESLQRTPVAVSALSNESIEKMQITDISALQNVVPSFTVAPAVGDTSAANISVRGQTQSDNLIALDPAVGIYLDGVYVARSSGALLNLVDLKRVEVLRGVQGTLFGRNTTGGAVNMVSNMPSPELGGSVKLRAGDYGLFGVTAIANIPLGESAGLRVAYQHEEHDGYGRNTFTKNDLNNDKVDFVRGTFQFAPAGSNFELLLSGDYTKRSNDGQLTKLTYVGPLRFIGATPVGGIANLLPVVCAGPAAPLCAVSIPGDTLSNYIGGNFYENQGNTTPTYNRSEVGGLSLNASYEFSGVTVRLISAERFVKSDSQRDLDGTPYWILGGLGHIDQDQYSNELQFSGDGFGDRFHWIGGLFDFHESGFDNSASQSLFPVSTNRSVITGYAENDSFAIYGQGTFDITDSLRLTGGLRKTWDSRLLRVSNENFNGVTGAFTSCALPVFSLDDGVTCQSTRSADFDYVSYTVSLDYQLSSSAFLYAKTSRGSRAGGFNVRGVTTASLSAFEPEEVTDYEVGVKSDFFDRRLRVNGALYYSDYSNIQRSLISSTGGVLVAYVQNAASAHVNGFELEVIAIPVTGLTLSGVLGITDAQYDKFIDPATGADRSSEPFPRTPKTTYSLSADYRLPTAMGDLVGHIDYGWRSEIYFNTSAASRQDSYGLVNATLKLEITDDIELSVWARNLAGEEYMTQILDTTATPIGVAVGFPGEPRTVGVSAGYRF